MPTEWSRVPTPPEPRSARGRDTRQRMILAAADLFADQGIDAVSPSDILAAAGQRNASAIQYHFGSHEGLVIAVLQPRPDVRGPVEERRTDILDTLLSGGDPLTLDGAVRALVEPFLLLLETHEARSFIRVAAQVVRALPLEDRVSPAMPSERRALAAVARAMPPLPEAVRDERIAVLLTLLIELLANRAREIEQRVTPNLPADAFGRELVAMLVGLLSAPSPAGA